MRGDPRGHTHCLFATYMIWNDRRRGSRRGGNEQLLRQNNRWLELTLTAVDCTAAKFGLSNAEREIVAATMLGTDRRAIAETRAVAASTLKTQVRCLLLKTGDATLAELRDRLLRDLAACEP